MYFYACPYCWEDGKTKARLIVVKSAEATCKLKDGDHKAGFFKDKDQECKKNKFKCREVMHCTECGAEFRINDEFLKSAKKKDKDG